MSMRTMAFDGEEKRNGSAGNRPIMVRSAAKFTPLPSGDVDIESCSPSAHRVTSRPVPITVKVNSGNAPEAAMRAGVPDGRHTAGSLASRRRLTNLLIFNARAVTPRREPALFF